MRPEVERWRPYAREHAATMAARYGVALDESDVLALIEHESKGDPTVINKNSGCRGLGQFAGGAVKDYNADNPGHELTWADMIDPDKGPEQVRAVAWLLADSRKTVSSWSMPDAKINAHLWGDLRYGWGGGNTKDAIAKYKAEHGKAPTFDELEDASEAAFDEDGDGKIDIRPFIHARSVARLAEKDRGGVGPKPPFRDPDAVAGDGLDRCGCCCAARRRSGGCPLGDGRKKG